MTDNEIIKALECCSITTSNACTGCPLYSEDDIGCIPILTKNSLDLINRQKAEIEKFEKIEHFGTKTIEAQTKEIKRLNSLLEIEKFYGTLTTQSFKTAKAEAIEEFAERLREIADKQGLKYWVTVDAIDDLVKEMTSTN